MKYPILCNDQRDNENFTGKFPGYAQCFSTSVWMDMSHYSLEIDALDDKALAKYVDDVEAAVGIKPGLAETIMSKDPFIKGKTSLFWKVQQYGMTAWLNGRDVRGTAIFEENKKFSQIKEILKADPVIIGTNQMGGLPAGHIILGIGYDDIHIICNDPFGNAKTDYKDHDGASVYYEDEFLKKYFTGRLLYWRV
jgi:hypothetical protein